MLANIAKLVTEIISPMAISVGGFCRHIGILFSICFIHVWSSLLPIRFSQFSSTSEGTDMICLVLCSLTFWKIPSRSI